MILGNRKAGAPIVVLAISLMLLGFLLVLIWVRKKNVPKPEAPMHASLTGTVRHLRNEWFASRVSLYSRAHP
jgi:hypothetical protein